MKTIETTTEMTETAIKTGMKNFPRNLDVFETFTNEGGKRNRSPGKFLSCHHISHMRFIYALYTHTGDDALLPYK